MNKQKRTVYSLSVMWLSLLCCTEIMAQNANWSTHSEHKGLTFGMSENSPDPSTGVLHLSCQGNLPKGETCNPYQGDYLCALKLPVLCFHDIDAPAPVGLKQKLYWSGGILATSQPRSGHSFSSVGDVNEFCASEFGQGWRVANFHDGGGWKITAYGNIASKNTRVWTDIKDQNKGSCWSR